MEEGVLTFRPPEEVRRIDMDSEVRLRPAVDEDLDVFIVLNLPDFLMEEYTPALLDLDRVALAPGLTFRGKISPLLCVFFKEWRLGEVAADIFRVGAVS